MNWNNGTYCGICQGPCQGHTGLELETIYPDQSEEDAGVDTDAIRPRHTNRQPLTGWRGLKRKLERSQMRRDGRKQWQ